jgi:hypothetical protein
MNATMVASGTKAVPPVVSSIQDIPLAKIRESKSNPRRLFDEAKLVELAASVPGNRSRVMWHSGQMTIRLAGQMSLLFVSDLKLHSRYSYAK